MPPTRDGMSNGSEMAPQGDDTWPPTQIRLSPSEPDEDEPRPILSDIDDDPLTFFLTPAPEYEDGDMGGDPMDFDAGIEDSSRQHEPVRSVSPSNLEGLSKPDAGVASLDPDSDVPTPDEDDDEDYIRLSPNNFRFFSLPDLTIDSRKSRPRSPVFGHSANANAPLPSALPRGRPYSRVRRAQSRSLSARAVPRHLWREPSPDVWSIEEETEEELMSDLGSSVAARSDIGDENKDDNRGFETVAAKPVKKVRFLLPVKD